jgi:hypothetical protein
MTAKQYFQQAFLLNQRIESNRDEIARLRVLAEGVSSPQLSADRIQSSGNQDKMAQTICKIIDLEHDIQAEIDSLIELRREIRERINAMPDDKLRLVLQNRYLNFQKWENIAVEMNYAFQWVMILHNRALKEFNRLYFDSQGGGTPKQMIKIDIEPVV